MATKNSISSDIPIEISKGGTNATSLTTSYGTIYYDSSKLATVASVGTLGQVLKSNGASAPTFQTASSGGGVGISSFLATLTSTQTNVTGAFAQTFYNVPFNTEVYDTGGDYNNSTGEFIAPVTGKYLFGCHITVFHDSDWYRISTGISTSNIGYLLDCGSAKWSNNTREASGYGAGSYTGYVTHSYIVFVDMDASDSAYGVAMCTTDDSSITTDDVDVIGDAEMTYFFGTLIGT